MAASERDEALERFCSAMWQCHEVRQRHPGYRAKWPSTATFKAEWPHLAPDLIEASWMIEGAEADSEVTTIAYALLDPPAAARVPWRLKYADELARFPRIAWDFAQANPVASVFRRAALPWGKGGVGLTPDEDRVARLRMVGDSYEAIARAVGRRKGHVWTQVQRALGKLRELGRPPKEDAA